MSEEADCWNDTVREWLEAKTHEWLEARAKAELKEDWADFEAGEGTAKQGVAPTKDELVDIILDEVGVAKLALEMD